VELESLEDAIAERVGRSSQAFVTIWMPASVWELDVAQWRAVPLARRLGLHGVGVRFCLPSTDVPAEQDKRMRLLSLVQTTGADLVIAGPLGIEKQFKPLAHLSGEHGALWAAREKGPGAEAADNPWRPGGNILRCAGIAAPNVHTLPLSALALKSDSSLVQVDIGFEIDGSLNGFGQRFWKYVASKTPFVSGLAQSEVLQRLEYTDRYLRCPLAVRLAYEIMQCTPGLSKSTAVQLTTTGNARSPISGSYPSKLFHDWARDTDRRHVTQSLMERIAQAVRVDFAQRSVLPHARVLSLGYGNSTVQIYLDQGVGFWRIKASEAFDFTRDAAIQAEKLLHSAGSVAGDRGNPMPIWLRRQ
jgi:hypothetical protein